MESKIRLATLHEASLQQGQIRSVGTLNLTLYQIIFQSATQELWIPYALIDSIVCKGSSENGCALQIRCRTFQLVTLVVTKERDASEVLQTIVSLLPEQVEQLEACKDAGNGAVQNENWNFYNAKAEYERMGVGTKSQAWRISDVNKDYQLCDTYPRLIVVPSSVSDETLTNSARFRSRGRLPVLSYLHLDTMASITRCSQPLVGINQKRNYEDEGLVRAIFSASDEYRAQQTGSSRITTANNLILDARPRANAYVNVAMGKGFENTENYVNCRRDFLGIDNIHVMRDSLEKLVDATLQLDQGYMAWNIALDNSGWLKHLRMILEASNRIVRAVAVEGANVLVHCSDGWDRTAQLTGLSMLCLDPFYRTVRGFITLIEKEWISIGYNFLNRHGHLVHGKTLPSLSSSSSASPASTTTNSTVPSTSSSSLSFTASTSTFPNGLALVSSQHSHFSDTSPVFLQFLDCTWQLIHQFPDQFEFTGAFLRALFRLSHSGDTGTFLFNCERERERHPFVRSMPSAWTVLLQMFDDPNGEPGVKSVQKTEARRFKNPRYLASLARPILFPSSSGSVIRFWRAMYCPNEGTPLLSTLIRQPAASPTDKATTAENGQESASSVCPPLVFDQINAPGPNFIEELDDPTRLPLTHQIISLQHQIFLAQQFLIANNRPLPEPLAIPVALTDHPSVHPRSTPLASLLNRNSNRMSRPLSLIGSDLSSAGASSAETPISRRSLSDGVIISSELPSDGVITQRTLSADEEEEVAQQNNAAAAVTSSPPSSPSGNVSLLSEALNTQLF